MGNSNSILVEAVRDNKDSFEIFKILDEYPNSLNEVDSYGNTALMWAMFHKDGLNISKILINKNIKLNIRNNKGVTALMGAVNRAGNLDIVKLLIEKGANVNIRDNNGNTAFNYAVDITMKNILINNRLDLNIKYGDNILIAAIKNRDVDVIKVFIKNKIEIEKPSLILEYCKSLGLDEIYDLLKNYMLGFK